MLPMLNPLSARSLATALAVLVSVNLGACNALLRQSFERDTPSPVAVSTPAPSPPPVQANFYCQNTNGQWQTFVNLEGRKDVVLLTWQTTHFELTPEERCFQVTDRFNQFYPDRLRSLKAGELNGYPVICIGSCSDGEVLFTLPPGSVAQDAYDQLTAMVNNAFTSSNQGIPNPNGITYPGDGFAHLDIQYFFRQLSQ